MIRSSSDSDIAQPEEAYGEEIGGSLTNTVININNSSNIYINNNYFDPVLNLSHLHENTGGVVLKNCLRVIKNDCVRIPVNCWKITRQQWGGCAPSQELESFRVCPVPYVVISHTAGNFYKTTSECCAEVRNIQMYHFKKGWSDIAYNFLAGGDGRVYEGRGWTKIGAHCKINSKSIGISFMGNFMSSLPEPCQIEVVRRLLDEGVGGGYIAQDYKLLAHKQVSTTVSPGQALAQEIKSWPHWSSVV